MMEWMLLPLKRYADFSGRSRRKEYWMFTLLSVIVYAVGFMLLMAGGFTMDPAQQTDAGIGPIGWVGLIIMIGWALGTLIPTIAVHVRRFHDQDKSGWFYLISFIPYVGGLIVLVFMFLEGTQGTNRFGADPKGGADSDVFA